MSLKKSATRRLSLLAGASLVAASLGVFTGAALAPTLALAANECVPIGVDPSANGSTADTYACAGASTYQTTGISYSSDGNLTVNATGAMNVGAVGVNLTGNTTDSVTFTSTAAVTGTSGPVIDITSVSGSISTTTNGVTATGVGATHGIRAVSTGGGNITTVGSANNNSTTGLAAIEAITNGGNISITTATGFTTGRARGIRAQTSGAGTVTVTANGQVTANAVDGIAAIDVTAGTGATIINVARGVINGGAGDAIVVNSGGAVTVNNTGGSIGSLVGFAITGGRVDFSGVTGPGVTFSNAGATIGTGVWAASGDSVFSAGNDTLNMTGVGQNLLLSGASIDFGSGNDTFNMSALFTMGAFTSPNLATLDFGSGADTFNMSGAFTLNGTTISNLEAFNNSGLILMGVTRTGSQIPEIDWEASDGVADDRLSMPGTTFTGSGSSRIVMDAALSTGAQPGCDTLTVADCLDLRGGATAGLTTITVNNLSPDAQQAGYDPVGITLVDVGGGTSARGHFVLDPNIFGFDTDPLLGDVIDRPGLFRYALRYDAENQRHILASLPRWELFEYGILANAAHSIWHMTASTVTDRQSDLRDGNGNTVWLRTTGEYSKRDAEMTLVNYGETFTLDNSYKLYAGTIMGGRDFIVGGTDAYDYVAGAQIGYVSSSFDFDESESSGRLTGATGGVYASLWSDWFFLDGAVNLNGLTLDYENPALGSKTTTFLNSIGAQADAGIRTKLTENTFAEPLMTLSWVRSSFEEISLSGGEIKPADAKSLRGALGMRLGSTLAGEAISASYFVTGRAWYEFEGENGGLVANPGADMPFTDEFTGAFGEAALGVNVFNTANTLSGFLASGVKWKEGYSATNLSLGMRMAW